MAPPRQQGNSAGRWRWRRRPRPSAEDAVALLACWPMPATLGSPGAGTHARLDLRPIPAPGPDLDRPTRVPSHMARSASSVHHAWWIPFPSQREVPGGQAGVTEPVTPTRLSGHIVAAARAYPEPVGPLGLPTWTTGRPSANSRKPPWACAKTLYDPPAGRFLKIVN